MVDKTHSIAGIRLPFLIAVILLISISFVYDQVSTFDFINYDDMKYVVYNPHLTRGFSIDSILWSLTTDRASNWHPITWFSHMLDVELFGVNADMHHLTNLLIHIINSLLLYYLFLRMTGAIWRSAFVAALFALHPINVETVAWISERKNVLSTLFWFLTMWSYVRYVEKESLQRFLTVLLFFILGLMAKPMLVTLPFVLLLLDYWPLRRLSILPDRHESLTTLEKTGNHGIHKRMKEIKDLVFEKTPLFIASAASCVITLLVQRSSGAIRDLHEFPLHERIANAVISYVMYLKKVLWPVDLAAFYPYPETISLWSVLTSVLVIVVFTGIALWRVHKNPYLAVGWFWYLGTLVPVIGLVQAGGQAMADRYAYVPLIGIFIGAAWGGADLFSRLSCRKSIPSTLFIAIVAILSIFTWLQTEFWKDTQALFEHANTVTSNNHVALKVLGTVETERGNYEAALFYYNRALSIRPDFDEVYGCIGDVMEKQGKTDEALFHYFIAVRGKPDFAEAHVRIGNILEKRGLLDDAAAHYEKALAAQEDTVEAHNNLGAIEAIRGNEQKASEHFIRVLELDPGFADAYFNMGNLYLNRGKFTEAIRNISRAIMERPDYPEAYNNLGIAWIQLGEVDQAIFWFEKALEKKPDYATAIQNLMNANDIKNLRNENPARIP